MKKYLQMILILAVWNFCNNASQAEHRKFQLGGNYQQRKVGRERKNKNNKNKQPGLHEAVRNGNKAEVERLLNLPYCPESRSWPANPNKKDQNGCTPLMLAVQCREFECMDLLLKNERIDITIRDNNDETVIHWAVKENSLSSLKHIQQYKNLAMSINLQDSNKNSALHLVRNKDIAKFLIQNGARFDIKNSIEKTPEQYAEYLGKNRLAEYLQQQYGIELESCINRDEIRKRYKEKLEEEVNRTEENKKKRKDSEKEKTEVKEAERCQFCLEEIQEINVEEFKFKNCNHFRHHECQKEAAKNGYNGCTACYPRSQKTSAAALQILQSDEELARQVQQEFDLLG